MSASPETVGTVAEVKDVVAPPVATRGQRTFCLYALIAILVTHVFFGLRSIGNEAADFEYFYKASSWLLENGNLDGRYDVVDGQQVPRGGIEWYLPVVPRLYTNLSWMPHRVAGVVWLAFNIAVFFAMVRLLGQFMTGLPPQDWAVTQLVPVVALSLFWHWEFRLNQINNLTLLLLLGAFVQWQQGRRALPGFWLGLAVLLKLTPGLLVIWFALKRQYRIVFVAGATFLLAGPVGDLIVFGPEMTRDAYQSWFQTAVVKGSHRGLILHQREMDWRNQALGAVSSRLLHATNYTTHFDNDPRIRYPDKELYINIVDLPLPIVATLVLGIAGASLLGLLWIARRPARACPTWQLRLEYALFIMAMLWFMPVMRRYHLVWMLPAISVLMACMHHVTLRDIWSRTALTVILIVVGAQVAILTRTIYETHVVEASGAFLLSLPLVAFALVWLILRLQRNPRAVPPDRYCRNTAALDALPAPSQTNA